ncbi:phosphatase PAP2/dual specificity phosphatase family protein [Pseudomonas sp. ANT_H14]|uniref:phosphatase PAP2/dual specificity phosphatase family protein n=1 Tax=unclassified Pseudomonas TaxID=196821 RepID=UPI0011EDEC5B|nr:MULTISPECIES: phosphatase PAP2/dual specificity phosphatase family protein [unclassified Pseudomonas]KAA0950608.1 phosphatase PAP2/dual specificity phosphatase family protein [Pseudomonas sp. ANT_H4]KAA0952465.1 phosphatase PAP2/dual specificity phosphatase family protein [Pseudomonas sp. ANT_H14]
MRLTPREQGLLKPAVLWLLLLAPLFFSTYGFATWVTSQRSDVGTMVFGWETHIPFWAWTIVPYWSIDLLYGFSLLLPNSRHELKQHALRLLTAQVIAVSCFLVWPLRFTFERPEMDGVFGWLFAVLAGFDKPFNQAPSLHIALLVILWIMFQRHTQGVWRWLVHGWFTLIGISVLTTYQHHFIDLPTGALAGWLCVWLWPLEHPSPLLDTQLAEDSKRWQLGMRYALGALALAIPAFTFGGWWLWLLWPAVAVLLVAFNYLLLDAAGFQKRADGKLSSASRWLYAPYLGAAWINSRLWTRKHPQADQVVDNVWLGRIPTTSELTSFKAVVDLCAELPLDPQGRAYYSLPVLDLTAPTATQCLDAAHAIERLREAGSLLVCCALGYSRSATAVAAWLLNSGRAATVDEAVAIIRTARPGVVLHPAHRQALGQMLTHPSPHLRTANAR